jgi:glycosyltransferase involved in cell wall biosynthesis
MNPLVSVIIPVFNGERFLADALSSVQAQDYQPLEVLVVDDGSTDASATLAESFAGVRCLRLEHAGVSRSRNLGVAASSSEWLAFLDADDIWLPGKISAQVAATRADPELEMVFCKRLHRMEVSPPEWFIDPANGGPATAYEPSAWLVRRDCFERVGPFDEQRHLAEDTEWLARAFDLGIKYAAVEEVLLTRRIHGANATGQIQSHRRVVLDVLRESVRRKQERANLP